MSFYLFVCLFGFLSLLLFFILYFFFFIYSFSLSFFISFLRLFSFFLPSFLSFFVYFNSYFLFTYSRYSIFVTFFILPFPLSLLSFLSSLSIEHLSSPSHSLFTSGIRIDNIHQYLQPILPSFHPSILLSFPFFS